MSNDRSAIPTKLEWHEPLVGTGWFAFMDIAYLGGGEFKSKHWYTYVDGVNPFPGTGYAGPFDSVEDLCEWVKSGVWWKGTARALCDGDVRGQ